MRLTNAFINKTKQKIQKAIFHDLFDPLIDVQNHYIIYFFFFYLEVKFFFKINKL